MSAGSLSHLNTMDRSLVSGKLVTGVLFLGREVLGEVQLLCVLDHHLCFSGFDESKCSTCWTAFLGHTLFGEADDALIKYNTDQNNRSKYTVVHTVGINWTVTT